MYQSERAGDEAKKCKSPAKSGRVGIYGIVNFFFEGTFFGKFSLEFPGQITVRCT